MNGMVGEDNGGIGKGEQDWERENIDKFVYKRAHVFRVENQQRPESERDRQKRDRETSRGSELLVLGRPLAVCSMRHKTSGRSSETHTQTHSPNVDFFLSLILAVDAAMAAVVVVVFVVSLLFTFDACCERDALRWVSLLIAVWPERSSKEAAGGGEW